MNPGSSDYPLVSLIIPCFSGTEALSNCLSSLSRCNYRPLEIIVVDPASGKGSLDWVEANHSNVKVTRCGDNYGHAKICMCGAAAANGQYLAFISDKTVQEPDWLEILVATVESRPGIGAVQPKILNYGDKKLFDYAGGSGGAMDLFCYSFARGRVFLTREKDEGQYDDETQIFWASGTAFLVRKSLFEEAGGFDDVFFDRLHEIDLQWRIQLMGYRVYVNPRSVVYHKNAVTPGINSAKRKYLNHRNSLMMMLTNYNLPLTIYLFPIRLLLEFAAVIYAVILTDFSRAGAVLKSLVWIVTHPGTIYRKRKKTRALRKLKDREMLPVFYKGSVVLNYYILGKRRYSDLISKHSR